MKAFVTGHLGKVGRHVAPRLAAAGFTVAGYDLREGDDLLDTPRLADRMAGADVLLHLAAVPREGAATAEATQRVNVAGTAAVLAAAARCGVRRVVFMSSVGALGVFDGRRPPRYLPLDDEHPCLPLGAYGRSKLAAEDLCAAFSARTGIATMCLRPPWVADDEDLRRRRASWVADPRRELRPHWEYGAFLHIEDLAEAVYLALTSDSAGHQRLLLSADDMTSLHGTSLGLARRCYPAAEWRGGDEYLLDPWRALIVTDRARALLRWQPRRRWRY